MNRAIAFLVTLVILVPASRSSAQWVPDGVGIATGNFAQERSRAVSDGAGGVLVSWQESRVGHWDIYVQRLNGAGVPLWTATGVALCTEAENQQEIALVPDGAGGAIVVWEDFRTQATSGTDIYCRRIRADGVAQWNPAGVPLCVNASTQTSVRAISDGSGGAVVSWRDARNGVDYDVYAQRVNASGVVQWTANGVAIATQPGDQTIPDITTDGAGGAIIAWFDRRSSPDADVYAQRVSAAGVPLWADDGVSISSVAGVQRNPELVPDGAGGAFISWWDSRSGNFDIYAQRVSSTGVPQWTVNGVPVCVAGNDQLITEPIASGTGVIIAWHDNRAGSADIYAQGLNGQGVPAWAANGVEICGATGDQYDLRATTDGSGGVIMTWADLRTGQNEEDIYAQRVTSAGISSWTLDGVQLSGADSYQVEPQIASDGAGGAIVVWNDHRTEPYDVYGQRILSSGSLPFTTSVLGRAPSMRASEIYPNPMASTAWLDVELNSPATVQIDVFDVAGRRVRTQMSRQITAASRIVIEARDDAGRMLPSGVYFCRVRAAGETITRKLVIAR